VWFTPGRSSICSSSFAERVATLSELLLPDALLQYTNLYIRFGLGREPDRTHADWQKYVAGLREARDGREWTYRFYLERAEAAAGPPVIATFGCFAYSRRRGDRLRLHFQNTEVEGASSLGSARRIQRVADLAALFGHVKATEREPLSVVGASWLYNLEAYRRLFPKSYLATARVLRDRFQRMPLWGQFLDRHGGIKQNRAHQFLERLERQSSLENLDRCFPLPVLTVEAPIREFYAFYGV
jgi:hypothetical protein